MRLLIAVAMAVGLASVPLEQVAACSCATATIEESASMAETVFAGTVVDEQPFARDGGPARPVAATVPMPAEPMQTLYVFEVDGVAKGSAGQRLELLAGGDGASCGMSFALGDRWLVFATWDGAFHTTNLCAGNVQLGPDEKPPLAMASPAAAPDSGTVPIPPAMLGILAVIGVLTAVSWVAFRREPLS